MFMYIARPQVNPKSVNVLLAALNSGFFTIC